MRAPTTSQYTISRLVLISALVAPILSIFTNFATYVKTTQRIEIQMAQLEKTTEKIETVLFKNILDVREAVNQQQRFNTAILVALKGMGIEVKRVDP